MNAYNTSKPVTFLYSSIFQPAGVKTVKGESAKAEADHFKLANIRYTAWQDSRQVFI